MHLNYFTLLLWLNAGGLVTALLGAYPTWRVWGRIGLACEVTAAMIVGIVMLCNAMMLMGAAISGPARVTFSFCVSGIVRLIAAIALAFAAHVYLGLPWTPLMLWVGGFYLVLLHCEAFWLAGALKRDAHLVALGKLPRDNRLEFFLRK
ncbi:MAG: hypothetical protein ACLFV7_13920 [Phycisphaerae bacterium]